MGRTFVRQDAQIQPSDVYDDTLASGATLESGSTNIQDDLNSLRSQIKRILNDAAGNWYDDVPTVNSKKRDLTDLNTDLDDLEEQKFLCRANLLTDITVSASQNWQILSVAGSEAPTQVAAVALTQDGAVVAQSALSGAGFDVHELIEVAGPDAISPKNLLIIRNAADGTVLQSSGRDIYGLLQYESTGTDGAAFNDTSAGNRVKLSFVRQTATFDDLEACPVADIENQDINYSYVRRIRWDDFPEDCFMSLSGFVDKVGSVDVTRQNAYNNQGTTPVDLTTSATLDLEGAGLVWSIRDDLQADLFRIVEGSAGGTTQLQIHSDVDLYNNDAVDVSFASGIAVGDGGTEITINETAGEINRAADLRLKATGAGELYFADSNEPGGWSLDGIKLSDTAQEWTDYEAAFGEVSLLAGILAAYNAASPVTKTHAVVTANISANNNVGGPATANNLDVNLPALIGWTSADTGDATFLSDNDVYLNGVLLRGGTTAAANNDYYPGTTDVQLKFEFALKFSPGNPDVLCVISRG